MPNLDGESNVDIASEADVDGADGENGNGDGTEEQETPPADAGNRSDMRHLLFLDSTHRFLFMEEIDLGDYGVHKMHPLETLFIFINVNLVQMAGYVFLWFLIAYEAHISRAGGAPLEIPREYCGQGDNDWDEAGGLSAERGIYDGLEDADVALEDLPRLLRCSDPSATRRFSESTDFAVSIHVAAKFLATLLVSYFLLPDLVGASLLVTCPGWRAKLAAGIILLEACLAMIVGISSLSLVDDIGYLDTFFLFVGIIFIHEIDEKWALGGRMLLPIFQLRGRCPLLLQIVLFVSVFYWASTIPLWFGGYASEAIDTFVANA